MSEQSDAEFLKDVKSMLKGIVKEVIEQSKEMRCPVCKKEIEFVYISKYRYDFHLQEMQDIKEKIICPACGGVIPESSEVGKKVVGWCYDNL